MPLIKLNDILDLHESSLIHWKVDVNLHSVIEQYCEMEEFRNCLKLLYVIESTTPSINRDLQQLGNYINYLFRRKGILYLVYLNSCISAFT